MVIIAFSNKTSRFIPKILCRHLKHVAPIVVKDDKMILHQFVRRDIIEKLEIKMRDISVLKQYGWRFIYLNTKTRPDFDKKFAMTCVQMTKHAIGLRSWRIQTPSALYKKLKNLNYYLFWVIITMDF